MTENLKFKNVLILLCITYFSCNSFAMVIKYPDRTFVLMIATTLLTVVLAALLGIYPIPKRMMFYAIAMILNITLTSMFKGHMNAYLLLFLNIVLAFSIIKLMSRQEFFEAYIAVIKLLSIFAIVVGLLNILMPSALSVFSFYSDTGGSFYCDAILAFQRTAGYRINSIWGEAGMYSVYLIFALIFEGFFVDREIKITNFMIFSVALFLTFSANGLTLLAFLVILLVVSGRINSPKVAVTIIVLILVVLYATNNVDWISEQITASKNKLDSTDISFIGRLAPVLYNIEQGFMSPLWGHGIQSGSFYVDYSFYTGYLFCNTSTTTLLFSTFGIVFTACTLGLTWAVVKKNRCNNVRVAVILFVVMLLNINTQAIHLDQLYYLILFIPFMYEESEWQYSL